MQPTGIPWATYVLNVVRGCTHAGPECTNCYAERLTQQQAQRENPPDYVSEHDWTNDNAEQVVNLLPERLADPMNYHWPEGPGRIFVCSMSDLFHPLVPDEMIRSVIALARQFPEHIWILLTKRPKRAAEFDVIWPENIWLGTSVGSGPGGEYPDTTHRIDQLRQADAETLFISAEPLIEPLGDLDLDPFDWMIVGGESHLIDEERRDMDHTWARDLLDQCRQQDVAFYFKQSSGRKPDTGTRLTVRDDDFGVLGQKRIREYPELPALTKNAREGETPTVNA